MTLTDANGSDKNYTDKQPYKIFLNCHIANIKICNFLMICVWYPQTLKMLHQQTLHSDIYTVVIRLLSYISVVNSEGVLRKYFGSVLNIILNINLSCVGPCHTAQFALMLQTVERPTGS